MRWKDLGYDYDIWRHYLGQQPVGIISDPENALDVVHLVFNNREAISSKNSREAPSNQVICFLLIYYIYIYIYLIKKPKFYPHYLFGVHLTLSTQTGESFFHPAFFTS